jgi:hypothetical protein
VRLEAEPDAVPALATYLANAKRGTSLNKFDSIFSQLNIIYTAQINLLLLFVLNFFCLIFSDKQTVESSIKDKN